MSKRARVIVLERNKKQPQGGVTRIFKTEAERGSHVWASVILPRAMQWPCLFFTRTFQVCGSINEKMKRRN